MPKIAPTDDDTKVKYLELAKRLNQTLVSEAPKLTKNPFKWNWACKISGYAGIPDWVGVNLRHCINPMIKSGYYKAFCKEMADVDPRLGGIKKHLLTFDLFSQFPTMLDKNGIVIILWLSMVVPIDGLYDVGMAAFGPLSKAMFEMMKANSVGILSDWEYCGTGAWLCKPALPNVEKDWNYKKYLQIAQKTNLDAKDIADFQKMSEAQAENIRRAQRDQMMQYMMQEQQRQMMEMQRQMMEQQLMIMQQQQMIQQQQMAGMGMF